MDNEKKPEELLKDDKWLDELLGPQDSGAEIVPDEQAAMDAGLVNPADIELEQLMAEFGSEISDTEAAVPETASQEPVALEEIPLVSANPVDAETPFLDEEFRNTFGTGEALEEAFAPPAEPVAPEVPEEQAPEEVVEEDLGPVRKRRWWKKEIPQKRRPAHKKGYGFFGIPHILATGVWLALAVIIGVTAGNVLWMLAADVLAFNQVPKTVTITVTSDDTIESIAEQLQEEELIRYPQVFVFFAELTGKAEKIEPGVYTLNGVGEDGKFPNISYDYNALLNAMRQYKSSKEIVENLLVPEGYTCIQIFELLEREGVCTVAELEEYAATGEFRDYWFLEGVEQNGKYWLEGYLFPDTYDFYKNDDPSRVLHKFLDAFDYRITDKMRADLETINETFAKMMRKQGYSESYIKEHTIGMREIVIIASMIERESPGADESYTISSVIYNRLASPSFSLLQIDATVNYAHILEFGNDDNLDYTLDSPYNTYVYGGLPVGPISNPGRVSLDAALNPEETNYYYYALYTGTRQHAFFNKLKDFEKFLKEQGYYD